MIKDTADTIVAHTVSYDMLKYMLFSEEFAQDENFFDGYMMPLKIQRYVEI